MQLYTLELTFNVHRHRYPAVLVAREIVYISRDFRIVSLKRRMATGG
jgi:hypothetical protein